MTVAIDMHITDFSIPEPKLVYLLTPAEKSDKSNYLARAGFTIANPEELRVAIENLVGSTEAVFDRENRWGAYYNVTGPLSGPSGTIGVVTVWIQRDSGGEFSFVTLVPGG